MHANLRNSLSTFEVGALGARPQVGVCGAPVAARPAAAIATWVTLSVVIAVGSYLRLAHLGRLGIHWDEDLSFLAVKAILAKGIPELPSGMIYLRGGPFLYAMAASAKTFGFGEFALRLPAALFGIGLIPLAFAIGRALVGARVGLLTAALISISMWDIEVSRYARMYAPFIFFYMLTLLSLWRYRVRTQSRAGGMLCVGLAVLTVSLHQLGYTLAAAMFYPLILAGPGEWRRARRLVFPSIAAAIVTVFFFSWSTLLDRMRSLPLEHARQALAVAPANPAPEVAASLPHLPLLADFLERSPEWFAAMAAVLLIGASLFAFRRSRSALERAAVIGVAASCAIGLFNVALLGILAVAWLRREGLPAFRSAEIRFVAGVTAASFCAWLLATVALGLAAPEFTGLAAAKAATRWSLLNLPHFFVFWGYVNQWPMASVPAIIGGLWAFDRAARRPPDAGAGFLLLALGTPLIANGLFGSHYELFRYDVPFDTLFFCCVSTGLLRWRGVAAAWNGAGGGEGAFRAAPGKRGGRIAGIAVGAILALLVLAFDLNPLRGALIANEGYRNDGRLSRFFGVGAYPDFKTPAAFVARHRAPGDIVIVLDSREMYAYLGHVDYWVTTGMYGTQTYERDGRLRDLYVATPLITSAGELAQTLAVPGRTKWLIASDAMLAATPAVDRETKELIRSRASHVVYVGRDGQSKVYRFP